MAFSSHRRLFNGRGAMARFVSKEKYKVDYPGPTPVGTQAAIYTS